MAGRGVDVSLNLKLRTDATPLELLKEIVLFPLIYIRVVGIFFSIVVFGCVADKGRVEFENDPTGTNITSTFTYCGFDEAYCDFATIVGVIAFLLCLAFLVKDVFYIIVDYSNNIVVKQVIILVDAITNGLWAFMWFVCLSYSSDQLRRHNDAGELPSGSITNCASSVVAFSFFNIAVWGAIVAGNIVCFVSIWRKQESEIDPEEMEEQRKKKAEQDQERKLKKIEVQEAKQKAKDKEHKRKERTRLQIEQKKAELKHQKEIDKIQEEHEKQMNKLKQEHYAHAAKSEVKDKEEAARLEREIKDTKVKHALQLEERKQGFEQDLKHEQQKAKLEIDKNIGDRTVMHFSSGQREVKITGGINERELLSLMKGVGFQQHAAITHSGEP